jgi:hypothetical protein
MWTCVVLFQNYVSLLCMLLALNCVLYLCVVPAGEPLIMSVSMENSGMCFTSVRKYSPIFLGPEIGTSFIDRAQISRFLPEDGRQNPVSEALF